LIVLRHVSDMLPSVGILRLTLIEVGTREDCESE